MGGQSSPGPLSNAARSGQIPYKASIFHMQFCNFAFQLSSGNPKAGDVPQSNLGFSKTSDTQQGPTVSILKSEHGAMRQPAKEHGPQRKPAIPHGHSKPFFLELLHGKSGEKQEVPRASVSCYPEHLPMFWPFVTITNPLSSISNEEKIRGKKCNAL